MSPVNFILGIRDIVIERVEPGRFMSGPGHPGAWQYFPNGMIVADRSHVVRLGAGQRSPFACAPGCRNRLCVLVESARTSCRSVVGCHLRGLIVDHLSLVLYGHCRPQTDAV